MVNNHGLIEFMRAIRSTEPHDASPRLASTPDLATAKLVTDDSHRHPDEFFLAECGSQIYLGHTAPVQVEVLEYLIEAGADVEAAAAGGVTPLHRAVRNRCSAAVEVLLAAGAGQLRRTARAATAMSLAQRMTGRGGAGSPEARREQERIVELLQTREYRYRRCG